MHTQLLTNNITRGIAKQTNAILDNVAITRAVIKRPTLFTVLLTLLVPSSLCASDDVLDTITVTADTDIVERTGDVVLDEFTGSHKRINKVELDRQDVNLGDILANEAGVQFRQVGGIGTLTTSTLRGGSSQQTSVFLDGILLSGGATGSVDLSMLELLNLATVDVYRGFTPVQLAQANIGGAVNLRTLGNNAQSTKLALTSGSFNTNKQQIAHRAASGAWDWVATASREFSNNDYEFTNNNATPLNPNDDTIEQRHNAEVSKLTAMGRVGFQWNNRTRSDLLVQASERRLGVPEWLNAENNAAQYDSSASQLQFHNRFDGLGNWNTALTVFQHQESNQYNDLLGQVGLGQQQTVTDTVSSGAKSYWEHIGDRGTLAVSSSMRVEHLNSRDLLSPSEAYDVSRTNWLSTASYTLFMAEDKLLLSPAIHLQYTDDDFDGISVGNRTNRNNSNASTQLGVKFLANDRWQFRANVGQLYREPTFSELFGNRGLIIGNSRLLPESGINTDLGFDFNNGQGYQLGVTLFASQRDELIALAFDSRGIGRSVNTGKASIAGVEISNELRFNKNVTTALNATYQHMRNRSANPALDNNEIPGQARLTMHGKFRYKLNAASLWFETNYKSDSYYDQANLLPAKAYALHNFGVDWSWRKFNLGMTINNIGNQNVQDFNGFPRPGRSFFLTLNYSL